jgi:hypothetical protein
LPYCSSIQYRAGSVQPTAILSDFASDAKQKNWERCAMAGSVRSLPRENPCAQCGRLIALPEWIETEPGRTFYLWRCMACDYRFEAVAYFDSAKMDHEPLAA